jgi:hypothetical protein
MRAKIGSKIVVLVPANMTRQPPSKLQKKIFLIENNLLCQQGLHLH